MSSTKTSDKAAKTADNILFTNQRVTDDDIYRNSTQFSAWSFTKESLNEIRVELANKTRLRYQQKIESYFMEEEAETLNDEEKEAIKLEFSLGISAEEQLQIVTLYTQKVQVFCTKLKLPSEVVATSMLFFKKFYITNSVIDLHPKNLIFTCIFLACKSENHFISAETFAAKVKQDKQKILENEFRLLESLKFSLMNHHLFKPLHGFYLDIQSVLQGKIDKNYLGTVYEKSKKMLINSYLSDAFYYYSPPHITLTALIMEDEQLILKYLELKFLGFDPETSSDSLTESQKISKNMYDKLMKTVSSCKTDIKTSFLPDRDTAWKIDARIHYFIDPSAFVKRFRAQKETASDITEEPDQKKQKVE
ncbi:hypothetical protein QEN19_003418 [Hanseniaspora menglaensis]